MSAMGKLVPVSVLLPLSAWLATCALLQGCGGPAPTPVPAPAVIVEILTEAGENVIAADAVAAVVGTIGGFGFTEGAAWVPTPHNLWIFSDIPENKMYQFDGSAVTEYRNPSGNANGNLWYNGKLLTCQHNRSVVRTDVPFSADTLEELVTEFNNSLLNSPNDIVIGKGGAMYFTDPGYGRFPGMGHGLPLEQEFRNLFRFDETTGDLVSLWRTVDGDPNGLVFNEDFTKLYLGDLGPLSRILVFDVSVDGLTLSNEQVFATCSEGGPDGMKMDALGNVWVTCGYPLSTPGLGVEVFAPDGTRIVKISAPEAGSNLAFGGAEGKTVMINAASSTWLIETKVTEMARAVQETALV